MKWGLRLQNFLGVVKLLVILLIVVAGWAALGGALKIDEKPNNFENAFEGTTGSAYGVVTAIYNVIWSYIGYSNANYALSETKNPVRTLKIAAPLALGLISVLYMLVNVWRTFPSFFLIFTNSNYRFHTLPQCQRKRSLLQGVSLRLRSSETYSEKRQNEPYPSSSLSRRLEMFLVLSFLKDAVCFEPFPINRYTLTDYQ